MSNTNDTSSSGVRMVALRDVTTREGFNPRTGRDPEALRQLTASIAADGILCPILVTPDGEGYLVVAGEGRWLAAHDAGLTEVPVNVIGVDERTGGLELAMVENMARQDLDLLQEALGFQRLLDTGLTRKGIAERLGVPQKRVTERLEILRLPEGLWPAVADGSIPPAAIRPLVKTGKIHPELPAVLAARVAAPPAHSWQPRLTWSEAVQAPIDALTRDADGDGTALPTDVYEAGQGYEVDRFTLTPETTTALEELLRLIGFERERFVVRFGHAEQQRAEALGVLHRDKDGRTALVVGQEVADELAADYITGCLITQREMAEQQATRRPDQDGDGEPVAVESEEELRARRLAEREAEQQLRRKAAAHNAELGAAVLKHLATVKVDTSVLKILTAIDVAGEIDALAMRGARYGFPGWPTQTTQKNGKVKLDYLGREDAGAKAREFLAGAKDMTAIAGRLLCLIAMARYTDEQAVAPSSRSYASVHVKGGVPYAGEVVDLIDALCHERLPDHLTAKVREERARQREEEAAREQETAAARERLEVVMASDGPLTPEEVDQAREDVHLVHGRYRPESTRIIKHLQDRVPAPPADEEPAPAEAA